MRHSPDLPAPDERGPYNLAAMQVTTTPLPKSRLQPDFELPPERLTRALDDAVRRLSRTTRVPGFRPGKAPRVMLERVLAPGAILDEAVDRLVDDAFREAAVERDIVPLTNPEVEVTNATEGEALTFRAIVQVRPELKLGDYKNFNFKPEIQPVDDTMVEKVIDEMRDQYAERQPVEGRGARKDDFAVVGFVGTRDGEPFQGGSSERMPLILGQERLIPGFEEHLYGMSKGEEREFDITFPDDYQEESLRGQAAHFTVELKELYEKVLPEANDDFAKTVGQFSTLDEVKDEVRKRLERNALDHARHDFADRIIDYATANATTDLPDALIDQEVEVMHDELRSTLARQGIDEEVYRRVSGKSEEDLHNDFRPQAEQRVKVLLTLSEIARAEGIEVGDAEVQAEIDRARIRYAQSPNLVRYFESERGRNYIRSTLRRTNVVEKLVDDWLTAHPESPKLPHLEDSETSPVNAPQAESAAALGATDPDAIPAPAAAPGGEA